jgi:hypothetical protein
MLLAIKSNPQSSRNSHSEETSKRNDFSVVTTKEMISKIHIAKNYGTRWWSQDFLNEEANY